MIALGHEPILHDPALRKRAFNENVVRCHLSAFVRFMRRCFRALVCCQVLGGLNIRGSACSWLSVLMCGKRFADIMSSMDAFVVRRARPIAVSVHSPIPCRAERETTRQRLREQLGLNQPPPPKRAGRKSLDSHWHEALCEYVEDVVFGRLIEDPLVPATRPPSWRVGCPLLQPIDIPLVNAMEGMLLTRIMVGAWMLPVCGCYWRADVAGVRMLQMLLTRGCCWRAEVVGMRMILARGYC